MPLSITFPPGTRYGQVGRMDLQRPWSFKPSIGTWIESAILGGLSKQYWDMDGVHAPHGVPMVFAWCPHGARCWQIPGGWQGRWWSVGWSALLPSHCGRRQPRWSDHVMWMLGECWKNKATGWLGALVRVTNLRFWVLRLRDKMLVFAGVVKKCLQHGHSFRLAGV